MQETMQNSITLNVKLVTRGEHHATGCSGCHCSSHLEKRWLLLSSVPACTGGQMLSALVGCAFRVAFGPSMFWLSAPLAMALSLTLMHLTRTVHAPGARILAPVSICLEAQGVGLGLLTAVSASGQSS